jgi:hypothetical protein
VVTQLYVRVNWDMSPHLILRVLEAIEADRAFIDLDDSDKHLVLFRQNQQRRDDLKPEKRQVLQLETVGLIALDTERSNSRNTRRGYIEFLGMRLPVPFAYFYTITYTGLEFLAKHRKP